jgi:hypothetical protein
MRERIVVICPTAQARMYATDWHDGQFAHRMYAAIARRRAEIVGRISRRRNPPPAIEEVGCRALLAKMADYAFG